MCVLGSSDLGPSARETKDQSRSSAFLHYIHPPSSSPASSTGHRSPWTDLLGLGSLLQTSAMPPLSPSSVGQAPTTTNRTCRPTTIPCICLRLRLNQDHISILNNSPTLVWTGVYRQSLTRRMDQDHIPHKDHLVSGKPTIHLLRRRKHPSIRIHLIHNIHHPTKVSLDHWVLPATQPCPGQNLSTATRTHLTTMALLLQWNLQIQPTNLRHIQVSRLPKLIRPKYT